MELVFNTSQVIRNITQGDKKRLHDPEHPPSEYPYLSTHVEMLLAVVFILLIGAIIGQKNLSKLACSLGFTRFKKTTNIPSVSLLMILECIYRFGAEFPKFIETAVKNYGEIFKINFLGSYDLVFITNPLMVQKLLMSSNPDHLHKPSIYTLLCVGESDHGLLSSPPDIWKSHRSVISKAFTYRGLLRQLNIFEEHAKRFILTLREEYILNPCLSKQTKPIDKQLEKLTFEIISHVVAGKQVYDLSDEKNERFHAEFGRMTELVSYRLMNFLNYPDFIWNLNPKKKELQRIKDNVLSYWSKIIVAIRKQFDADAKNGGASDDDMAGKSPVELMINAGFSNKDVYIELSTLLYGGHETSSSSIKIILFLLASHKDYQDKCRIEIDQMFEHMYASGNNEISMEALNSLTILDMCIKEASRLYVLAPVLGRRLESSLQLDENTVLVPGTTVFTVPWITHRNPKYYSEPEKFYPERFLPEEVKKRGLGEFFPFSLGPRNCIGYKSAMIELKVVTAYVLHNFELHTEMTTAKLDRLLSGSTWPHPELGITISTRN